ncbi:Transmembrane protein 42 [Cytospora mali]|uniref:Transmembrane protein 42 n=1 Tax=Cytospora mali TaxID=578113 RepID=A0A194UTB2_CYTMA|nr:Transmembrane protein 42 [Valsa mali var. pyri (nom. inval.)]
MASESHSDETRTLLRSDAAASEQLDIASTSKMSLVRQNKWIVLAIASGACAAFNGVFAKLTTGDATTSFAQGIARVLHLDSVETFIEYIVRAIFFGLNLLFNGVMWALFTQALAKGSSTTQVSIMNTSSNFFITAIMGLIIFSESLPPLWWVGAAFLVVGNVIIGKQDDDGKAEGGGGDAASSAGQDGLGRYEDVPQAEGVTDPGLKEDDDEDVIQLGDLDEE